ncbi:MAG TPA: sulfatase, partial [Candidatus Polarisedimenticolaceae bacterium]|nr:sulfatase [Candidatus Polarisedimenticolaceae bacterium]
MLRRLGGLLPLLGLVACASGPSPPGRPVNVVLITMDTVRADHLGCYGGSAATPKLDALARAGARFDQATAAAPLTLPSHATILSGLLPPAHGLRNNGGGALPGTVETLATRLSSAGYRTGAFVGAFVLDHRFGLGRGFDVYDDAITRGDRVADALEAERPGNVVVDRALEWLARDPGGKPFFLWVHLYDAHAPYAPPSPYREQYAGRLYDGEIAFVDAQVGRILAAVGPGALVAVVADHGEALGDHGEETHGLLLYQPTLRVPLLVQGPGIRAGTVVERAVGLADLAPTLASLAGTSLKADGRDLSAALRSGEEPPSADVYSETEYPRLFGWAGMAALRRGARKHIAS